MRNHFLLALCTLSISTALATAQPEPTTPTTTTTISVSAGNKALLDLISAGGTVTLLDKDGHTLGTVSADGKVTAADGVDLSTAVATSLKVSVTVDGKTTETTYTLASPLSKPGQLKVATVNVKGDAKSLPLAAVLHRQSEAAHTTNQARKDAAKTKTDDQDGDDKDAAEPTEPRGPTAPTTDTGTGTTTTTATSTAKTTKAAASTTTTVTKGGSADHASQGKGKK